MTYARRARRSAAAYYFLKKAHLGFPHLPEECLVARAERRAGPGQPRAAADERRARARPVVACADPTPVEILGAVRHWGCPLSYDGEQLVLIEGLEAARVSARGRYVLGIRLRDALEVHPVSNPEARGRNRTNGLTALENIWYMWVSMATPW